MTTRSMRPPLKHTPFTELLPDGTQFVTNPWYDWAMNLSAAVSTLQTTIEDLTETVENLLSADVTVWACDMLPSATNGCSALTVVEFDPAQPNFHALLFDATLEESADFNAMLPFSWAGKSFCVYVYYGHDVGATTFGVKWEIQANSTSDNETVILDFVGGVLVTDTAGVGGNLYIAAVSEPVPISSNYNRDGDMVSLRITRRCSAAEDTLNLDAALLAVRFVLAGALPILDDGSIPPTDPSFASVSLLVQGGADASLVINDLSSYASSVTITSNAEFDDVQQVFGSNTIKGLTIVPTIPAFTSSGAGSRFSRPSGESLTIECYFRYSTLANFSTSANLWYWTHSSASDRLAHIYTSGSAGTLNLRIGGTTTTHGALAANTTHFIQLTVTGNTYYLDLNGTQVGTGTFPADSQAGTYSVTTAGGGSPSSSGSGNSYWVTPFRWTKGVARARGAVPTAAFPTS